MPEVYVELNLRFPESQAESMVEILESANPGEDDDDSMFQLYGQLGEGVEDLLRESAENDPDWLDEQLTACEALVPQEFDSNGRLATIQYMVSDEETGENLERFMTDVFSSAGIEVINSAVINEYDLDEDDDYDEDFEVEEFEDSEM